MNAQDLLDQLRSRGVQVRTHGDRLRWDAPTGLSEEDIETLRGHKTEIIELLQAEVRGPPVQVLDTARELRDEWRRAVLDVALTLGWPELRPEPHYAVGPGQFMWRRFITAATVPSLQLTLEKLRLALRQVPDPWDS